MTTPLPPLYLALQAFSTDSGFSTQARMCRRLMSTAKKGSTFAATWVIYFPHGITAISICCLLFCTLFQRCSQHELKLANSIKLNELALRTCPIYRIFSSSDALHNPLRGTLMLSSSARRSRCCRTRTWAARLGTRGSLGKKARSFNALLLLHQRLQLAVHVADLKHKWHERLFKLALSSGIQHKPPPRCLSDEFVNSLGQGQELLLSNEGLFCPLHSGFQLCLQNLVFCLCSHHLSYHLQPVAASKNCDQRGADPSAFCPAAVESCACRATKCE